MLPTQERGHYHAPTGRGPVAEMLVFLKETHLMEAVWDWVHDLYKPRPRFGSCGTGGGG